MTRDEWLLILAAAVAVMVALAVALFVHSQQLP